MFRSRASIAAALCKGVRRVLAQANECDGACVGDFHCRHGGSVNADAILRVFCDCVRRGMAKGGRVRSALWMLLVSGCDVALLVLRKEYDIQ